MMTILLTGGTGKTATPLAGRLLEAQQSVLLATRSGIVRPPFKGVRFDWLDPSTYKLPFECDATIDRAYLVAPVGVLDPLPSMKAFIDIAIGRGVRRFVLLSGGILEPDGPAMGKVHKYLGTLGVEYCVLRPSWFFGEPWPECFAITDEHCAKNFITQYDERIRTRDEIVSAAGDGLVGYVSTEDIADVAFKALVGQVIEHTDPIIVGPELVSYDQIAALLTEVLGRKITHKKLTKTEFKQVLVDERGMPGEYAEIMAMLDEFVAGGAEERCYAKASVVGKRTLRKFFEENKLKFSNLN